MSIGQYKALVFDCYGTLIDWESGMKAKLAPLFSQSNKSEQDIMTVVGRHETRTQTETPGMLYPEVLYNTYKAAGSELGLNVTEDDARSFGNSVPDWTAFEDSAAALKKLQDLGLKLVILSNVNVDGFAASRKRLESAGAKFDAIYVAEKIGSYKPSLNNFNYMLEHIKQDLGVEKDEILVTANSILHDVQPGHKVGLKCAWIQRPSAVMGVSGFEEKPDFEFHGMANFADEMAKARA